MEGRWEGGTLLTAQTLIGSLVVFIFFFFPLQFYFILGYFSGVLKVADI